MAVTHEIIKLLLIYPEGLTSRQIDESLLMNELAETYTKSVQVMLSSLKGSGLLEKKEYVYRIKDFSKDKYKVFSPPEENTQGYIERFFKKNFKKDDIITSADLRAAYFKVFKRRISKQNAGVILRHLVKKRVVKSLPGYTGNKVVYILKKSDWRCKKALSERIKQEILCDRKPGDKFTLIEISKRTAPEISWDQVRYYLRKLENLQYISLSSAGRMKRYRVL